MGKAKRIKSVRPARQLNLFDQVEKDHILKFKCKKPNEDDVDSDEVETTNSKTTRRIVKQARQQLIEELGSDDTVSQFVDSVVDDEEEEEEEDLTMNTSSVASETPDQNDDCVADLEAYNAFQNATSDRKTLGQLIQDAIKAKEADLQEQCSVFGDSVSVCGRVGRTIDPALKSMYIGVGKVLSKYRSGRLPKAFKVISRFSNWEDLVLLTAPDKWTAAAMSKAVKIFASGLKEQQAQRFYNHYLLPRVRDDICTYGRLNVHLFQALKKSLFKPGAFFKGLLIPLCESRDCTLREAVIISSVLARTSIPILHASAAMLLIAEMAYSGANSVFLRVLLDKKYALPYRVVDALVFHLDRFKIEKKILPVLWHQMFLTFVQRYSGHISSDQRDILLELCRVKNHEKITPEIRMHLTNAKCRDAIVDEPCQDKSEVQSMTD